ncbi:hypothetical protein [Nonomuraea sp. GTA35]|uniref:hypothetical protein n=1 Tax=Nonomuraea sp. GTA35 TaxID=1676746 RepID=UPI0035C0A03B
MDVAGAARSPSVKNGVPRQVTTLCSRSSVSPCFLAAWIALREDGTPLSVLAFTVAGGRIARIMAVVDPARLASMDLPDADLPDAG